MLKERHDESHHTDRSHGLPFRRCRLVRFFVSGAMPGSVLAQDWVQPARSQANLDALARVQSKTYTFTEAGNIEQEYKLYVPTGYDGREATPLVIALHGLGSGTMYMMEYNNLVEVAEEHGFIVATPMGYNERGWYGARGLGNDFNRRREDPGPANLGALSELDVLNVLAVVRGQFNVDDRGIYLIGQSMGGAGTWYLGTKYPDIWAALAPMAPAAYGSPDVLQNGTHLPVMVVMGDADQLVDVNVTRRWVEKMRTLGMTYEYIEVPGGSHSSAGRENIGNVFDFLAKHRKP